jgi:hypothetical protein
VCSPVFGFDDSAKAGKASYLLAYGHVFPRHFRLRRRAGDSELIAHRIFARMINELGVAVTLEDMFEKFVGRTLSHCCELMGSVVARLLTPKQRLLEAGARLTFSDKTGLPDLLQGRVAAHQP